MIDTVGYKQGSNIPCKDVGVTIIPKTAMCVVCGRMEVGITVNQTHICFKCLDDIKEKL